MFKRKRAKSSDVVEITSFTTGETQTFKTGDKVDLKVGPTRNGCDICGELAVPGSRRCGSHRGLVFQPRDVVRGEYETRDQ